MQKGFKECPSHKNACKFIWIPFLKEPGKLKLSAYNQYWVGKKGHEFSRLFVFSLIWSLPGYFVGDRIVYRKLHGKGSQHIFLRSLNVLGEFSKISSWEDFLSILSLNFSTSPLSWVEEGMFAFKLEFKSPGDSFF